MHLIICIVIFIIIPDVNSNVVQKIKKLHHSSFWSSSTLQFISMIVLLKKLLDLCYCQSCICLCDTLIKCVASCFSNYHNVLIVSAFLLHRCCIVDNNDFTSDVVVAGNDAKKHILSIVILDTKTRKFPVCVNTDLLLIFHPWKSCCYTFHDDTVLLII